MFKWLKKSSPGRNSFNNMKNRTYPLVNGETHSSTCVLEQSLNSTADTTENVETVGSNPISGKQKRKFLSKFVRTVGRKLRGEGVGRGSQSWSKFNDSAVVLSPSSPKEDISYASEAENDPPARSTPIRKKWETVQVSATVSVENEVNPLGSESKDEIASEIRELKERRLSYPKALKRILPIRRNRSFLKDSRDSGWEGMSSSSSSLSSLVGWEAQFSASSPVTPTAVNDNPDVKRPIASTVTLSRQTTENSLSSPRVKMMFTFDQSDPRGSTFEEVSRESGLPSSESEIYKSLENISRPSLAARTRRVASWPNSHMSANNVSESVSNFFEEMCDMKRKEGAEWNDRFFSEIYSENRFASDMILSHDVNRPEMFHGGSGKRQNSLNCNAVSKVALDNRSSKRKLFGNFEKDDAAEFIAFHDIPGTAPLRESEGNICVVGGAEVGEEVEYQDICVDFDEEEEEKRGREHSSKDVLEILHDKMQHENRFSGRESRYVITMYV